MSTATAPRVFEAEATPSTRTGRPRKFGRYTLLQKIGHGGMATLYLARLDGPVGFEKFLAVKKIHPHLAEEHQFVKMFLDEARLAAQIQHPNVVQIFELGEVGGEYFFVMEYLESETLNAVARRAAQLGSSPRQVMAHIVARAADGLHAAHELRGPDGSLLGLVHRDVSPQNVLVTYDGLVKVVDFGIAKAANRLAHTETGQLKGKYAYMAPEQIVAKNVDRRADIFALGVVLYEVTTLRRLFKGDNELNTLDNVLRHEVPPPTAYDPTYPPELEQIVLRALRKNPAERFQTAAELAERLDRFALVGPQPASTTGVAAWMRQSFPKEAEDKRRMLLVGRTIPVSAATVTDAELGGRPRKRPLVLAAAIVAAFALATTLAVLFLGRTAIGNGTGTVRITATPVPAEVYIDGVESPLGQTPMEIDGLALGRHPIKLAAPGFLDANDEFVIQKAGQLATVVVSLERAAPEAGYLEISGPEGAEVSVDGTKQAERAPLRLELPPGPHVVLLSSGDLEPFEQRVTVEAGRTLLVVPPPMKARAPAALAGPAEAPAKAGDRGGGDRGGGGGGGKAARFGYLNLATTPWSVVYLGGQKLGTTPLVRVKLQAGSRRLKLLPEGREPARYVNVTIQPDETVRQHVPL